jgi:DNA-directed RNA polymerase II subunit RPB2
MGMVEHPLPLVEKMRELKLSMNINDETQIVYDPVNREARFATDSGRCCRPLFTTDQNGQLKITRDRLNKMNHSYLDGFLHLQAEGLVEYVDVEEEEHSMIAMFPHYIGKYPAEHKIFTKRVEEISMTGEIIVRDEEVVKKTPKYTHCEIHPGTVLGAAASTIVFAHHNPAARNTFQVLNSVS